MNVTLVGDYRMYNIYRLLDNYVYTLIILANAAYHNIIFLSIETLELKVIEVMRYQSLK